MQEKKFLSFRELSAGIREQLELDKVLLRKKSYQSYKSILCRFLDWKRAHPQEETSVYLRNLLITGLSARTVQSNLIAIRIYLKRLQKRFYEYAVYDLEDFKNLRYYSKSPAYFTDAQIHRLKTAIQQSAKHQLWVACELMYYCYIRPNEIRHLQVGDIDFNNWKILVRGAHAKNKRDQYVSVPPPLRGSLSAYESFPGRTYLFSDGASFWPGKELLGRDSLSKAFKVFLSQTGLTGKRLVFYSWKHTGVVKAVKAGVNIKDIQVQLRHHSLDMVNEYLKNLGVFDLEDFDNKIPSI